MMNNRTRVIVGVSLIAVFEIAYGAWLYYWAGAVLAL